MALRLGVPVHPWDTPTEFTAAVERDASLLIIALIGSCYKPSEGGKP